VNHPGLHENPRDARPSPSREPLAVLGWRAVPSTPPHAENESSELSLKPGDSLRAGRYAILGKLGEGGQATTFAAVDKAMGGQVTVKRFRVRGASSWKEVELAEREAKVLANVHHPNLPVYVDHFEEGGCLYLVTQHIEGETVAALRAAGRVSQDEVISFLADAASALEYLHSRTPPLVHRDIKPSNVIRRPDGSFAIIDFGAVRDRLKVTGSTVVGTFGFMAPEQFQGRAMPASDVYAVGATAIAMLTGQEPEELPHKGLAIDVETALSGRADPAMIRALASMVEPDPDRRAQSIKPLMEELHGLVGSHQQAWDPKQSPFRQQGPGGPRPPRAPSPPSPPPPPGTQRSATDERPSFWDEPARWNEGARVRTEASRQAERVVNEAEIQVKRVVEEVGDQVRRVVAEVSAGRSEGARREARRVAEVAKREAKRAFKDARRAAREAEHAGRDEARRVEAERRRDEAERRREAALARVRSGRAAPLGGPVLLLVLLSLTIAQLAVLLALKVITPMVLYLVSGLFFGSVPGRAMRAAARHVSAAGTRASTAIGRAKDVVRGRIPPATPGPESAAPESPLHVVGSGAVNVDASTEVSTVDHVDPYAHTHVSAVGRKEASAQPVTEPGKGRFADEARSGTARIEDEEYAEEEAAEEEAQAKGRGKK